MTAIPKPGDGATLRMYSDRHAYTVESVSRSGAELIARKDRAIRTDANGMSECQSYRFEPDPTAEPEIFHRCTGADPVFDDGFRYRSKFGAILVVGYRAAYHDYSF